MKSRLPLLGLGIALVGIAVLATALERTAPGRSLPLHDAHTPIGTDTALGRPYAAPDGTLWLTWTGPAPAGSEGSRALWLSGRDRAGRWSTPSVITDHERLMENWADFPSLTVGTDGQLWAQWFLRRAEGQRGYDGWFARSADRSHTWTQPAPLGHEFVRLAPLSGGRVLAVWLDGRRIPRENRAPGMPSMELHARLLAADGSTLAEWVVDPDVCSCCQVTLAVLPGDEVLVVYRGRTPGEVRDHYVARFNGTAWAEPQLLHADGWVIAGCPVNGPAAAALGTQVAVAWFTAANDQPRVRVAFSADGGRRFEPPQDVDLGNPEGRVDLLALDDDSALITWLENSPTVTTLLARRVWHDGRRSAAVPLAATSAARASGFARLARDDSGWTWVVFTDVSQEPARVRVLSFDPTRLPSEAGEPRSHRGWHARTPRTVAHCGGGDG